MPINTYQLFDGTLTIGAGPLQVAAQVTSVYVDPSENVTAGEKIPVLSGEKLESEEEVEFTFVLAGNFIQDLGAAGVVDYCWSHMGEEQPFSFIPNTDLGAEVEGIAKIVPVRIGGDVSPTAAPRSDFSFRCKGTPDFTPGT